MKYKLKQVVILLLFCNSFVALFAQKQKILVVPFNRFQFISEYKLSEIAQINNVDEQQVFNQYIQSLTNTLLKNDNAGYEFVPISETDYQLLKKHVTYSIKKFKGRKYNASNLNLLENEEYSNLLLRYQASFLLLFNWYAIQKEVHVTYIGDNNKRSQFSSHKLDFDIYNQQKDIVLGKGNVKLNCGSFPSSEMIESKGLKASLLVDCYNEIIREIITEITSK